MPRGPKGEKRPADVIGNAVKVMRIATGEEQDSGSDPALDYARRGGLKGGALEKLVQGYPTHGFVIDIEEAKTLFVQVRTADALECDVASALPGLLRPSSEPFVADVRLMFGGPKGTKNAQPKTARKARKAVPAPSGGRPGNVAELKRNPAGDAAVAEEDNHPRRSQAGNGPRPSIKPPDKAVGE